MANEARITSSLSIQKRDGTLILMDYNQPRQFVGTVTGTKGPTPGALTIPVGGKVVSLDELDTPGYYRITNLDTDNYVEYGIRDPATNRFYPWGEILPGESYVGRFSRNVREEYQGTGTGTGGEGENQIFFKANTADVVCSVEAFEA